MQSRDPLLSTGSLGRRAGHPAAVRVRPRPVLWRGDGCCGAGCDGSDGEVEGERSAFDGGRCEESSRESGGCEGEGEEGGDEGGREGGGGLE